MLVTRWIFKIVVALALGCSLSLGAHAGTTQTTINPAFYNDAGYSWWHRMSPTSREAAVKGAVLAIRFGSLEGFRTGLDSAEDALKGDPAARRAILKIERVEVSDPPPFVQTPRYYVRMIDRIYAARRATRKYPPLQILRCLSTSNAQQCDMQLR